MFDTLRASIIINNYNYGRFLADAIDSALAQTHRNTEVIVVDDGSTDNSRDVIRQFGDRVITVLKANGGQASAYNAGFAASRGSIVCFLDADDALASTAISEAAAAFQDSQLIKIEWRLEIMDELGRPTGGIVPERPLPLVDLRELTLSNGPFYDWLITSPSSGNCYRFGMLERVLPIPEPPFRHGADVYLTMLAPIFGGVYRLPQPQGRYRSHGKNNYFGRPLDECRLKDYLRRFDDCCAQLNIHLRKQRIEVEIDDWKTRNFNYLWPMRLLQAKSDIESNLPPGSSYVLVNNDEWGKGEPVEGRRALPFLECEGEYCGPPCDDQIAIAELMRLRQAREAKYIVFSWTAYWWFDQFPEFHAWLRRNTRCVLENDRLTIFDIHEMDLERAC